MASRKRVAGLLLAALTGSALAFGAEETPRDPFFERVRGTDELADPRINDIARDHTGFLWLATAYGGLVRHDGYTFRRFGNDPDDPGTLTDDRLRGLMVDREGMLWVSTWEEGLNRFDPRTERVTRYQHDPSDPRSLSHNQVRALLEDRQGRLWVGTTRGLNRLDRRTNTFVRHLHDPADPSSLGSDNVTALAEDPGGRLWIGTAAGGLHRFDGESGAFVGYRHDPRDPASLGDDRIQALAADPAGRIWIASWGGGLEVRDPVSGRFRQYRHDPTNPNSAPGDELFNVWVDPDGLVWVIDVQGGLARFDPATGRWVRFPHRIGLAGSPSAVLSGGAYHDPSSGALWLATYGQGVDVWHPTKPRISHYQHVVGRSDGLSDDFVTGVLEARDGTVWAGTRLGLDRLDEATGTFTTYRHDPSDPGSLAGDFVFTIGEGYDGTLWVGTWSAGLSGLDPRTGRFSRYPCGPGDPDGLIDCDVRALFEDSSGALWVGTYGGLHRLDRRSGRFTRYTHDPADPASLSNPIVTTLAEDGDGTLWVGTKSGLNRWHPDSGTFERYEHDSHSAGLAHPDVRAIYPARDGSLWLGTGAGLQRLRWDPSGAPRFESFDDLLPRFSVVGILEDDSGQLWLTTRSSGLWRFDPRSRAAHGFGRADGLPSGGSDNPAWGMRDGRLLLPGINGLAILDPATLVTNSSVPPVVITEVAIRDQPLARDPGAPAAQPLTLRYLDRVVSFEFAALDFQSPEQNRYRYRLEGFDADWREVDARLRRATYTGLQPGDYVFRVLGANSDGVWNTEGATLPVTVTPAWWQTAWFRSGAVAAVVGLALLLYRVRVRDMVRANRVLQLEVEERRAVEQRLLRSQEQLRRLSGELVQTQEEERRRVARELHDGINQKLAMLAVRIGLLARKPASDPGEAARGLEGLKQSTVELSQEVRRVSHQLHSSELEHLGLAAALRQEAAELEDRGDLAVAVDVEAIPEHLPWDAALCLYRVGQESLRNAAKHSGAGRIRIGLGAADAGVELVVQDDGVGFDVETVRARGGLGLTSMEERVRYLEGRFSLTSRPEGGTQVWAWVPIAPPEDQAAKAAETGAAGPRSRDLPG